MTPRRHLDEGHGLGRYADRVEVHCPRCAHPACVVVATVDGRRQARLVCAGCGLQAQATHCCGLYGATGDWFGPVRVSGRRPCGYCGHRWIVVEAVRERRPPVAPTRALARCRVCARESEVELEVAPYRGGEARDPHLGAPLRLTEPTRCGLLWAYNPEHLAELRRYVAADQRERSRVAGNASMISRLPTWMKLARHRPMLLKALDRLAARAAGA